MSTPDDVLVHKAIEPGKLAGKGLKRYQELIAQVTSGTEDHGDALLLPKYDGVYAQFIYNTPLKEWQAFSRTGERYLAVPARMLEAFDATAMPYLRYNGELWIQGAKHSAINGAARRKVKQDALQFVMFDAFDPLAMDTPYIERQEFFWSRGNILVAEPIVQQFYTEADLYDLAKDYKLRTSAYDGLILRDIRAGYSPGAGREAAINKIKPRHSGDFRIVGVTKGIGNREGGIGALVVALGGGVTTEVGTGLSMADVFRDPDYFIGQIGEIEYLEVTKDGKLREPVYLRIRHDKTEADTLDYNSKKESD